MCSLPSMWKMTLSQQRFCFINEATSKIWPELRGICTEVILGCKYSLLLAQSVWSGISLRMHFGIYSICKWPHLQKIVFNAHIYTWILRCIRESVCVFVHSEAELVDLRLHGSYARIGWMNMAEHCREQRGQYKSTAVTLGMTGHNRQRRERGEAAEQDRVCCQWWANIEFSHVVDLFSAHWGAIVEKQEDLLTAISFMSSLNKMCVNKGS